MNEIVAIAAKRPYKNKSKDDTSRYNSYLVVKPYFNW